MKKLFLLLGGAVVALNASAQNNSNSMPSSPRQHASVVDPRAVRGADMTDFLTNRMKSTHAAQKGTSVTSSDWWSFQIANDDGSALVKKSYIITYPDSNILITTAATPFYWWCMGTGTSFDPESKFFKAAFYKPAPPAVPPFTLDTTTGYWVDSVIVVGIYNQVNASQTDTLKIDITFADTTTAWKLQIKSGQVATLGITAAPDTTYRNANAHYDSSTNGLSTTIPNVRRIVKILDAAAAADTNANGVNVWAFALPTPMYVAKHKKVVALTHFASSVAHPLGTDYLTVNRWLSYTWDFNAPLQAVNDYNTGLVVTNAERHDVAADKWDYLGMTTMVPAYIYTSPVEIHNPFYMFYLRQTSSLSVNELGPESGVIAYPNPAGNELTVNFDVAGANNVNVTLVNAVGAVVATKSVKQGSGSVVFNTASLAAGMYFYTVEANGQRATGRVSIVH